MILPSKDIHCHLLPGVDDGFREVDSSLAAISKMMEAGVKEIVFTPHLNPDVYPEGSEEGMRKVYDALLPKLPEGLSTSLAAEYMVVKGFEERAADPDLLTYPDGSILVEMSYMFPSRNLETALFELSMAGRKPILAHPERYLYLANDLKLFDKYRDMGCRFQGNLLSFGGLYGKDSVKILEYLLKKEMYDFVATDLHSLSQLDTIGEILDKRKYRKLVGKICGW